MFKKAILFVSIVLALFTYKFPVLVPLGFILVAFSLYQVHRILLLNKDVIDKNTDDVNGVITTLLSNQRTIQSDLKKFRYITEKNAKKTDNKKGTG